MPINSHLSDNREYTARINRVLDHIELHIDQPFTLSELAGIANFSKFHFSRIFQSMTSESPFQFILRVRLQKAATYLCNNPSLNISEIAYRSGFSDISVFSRNFKGMFGFSPTGYRKNILEKQKVSNSSQYHGNEDQNLSNIQQARESISMYYCSNSNTIKWRTNMKLNKSVEVKELPAITVAYIRYTGTYQGNEKLFESLFNKLFTWAGPRKLLGPQSKAIVIYHDDPNVTDPEKQRMSVAVNVPAGTKTDGEFGSMEIAAGNYVVARFELTSADFTEAWNWLYGSWLPSSGYQPDDGPCFEMYAGQPKNGKLTVDICVPVKPL